RARRPRAAPGPGRREPERAPRLEQTRRPAQVRWGRRTPSGPPKRAPRPARRPPRARPRGRPPRWRPPPGFRYRAPRGSRLALVDDLGVDDVLLGLLGRLGRAVCAGAVAGRRSLLLRALVHRLGHLVEGRLQRLGLRVDL